MKKLNIYTSILFVTMMISLFSCEKFKILDSEDSESIPAGLNLKSQTIWEFISAENFHANDLTKIGYYGRAIEQAGLKDLLNGEGNFTVIIPTETSLKSFLNGIGYPNITDVPQGVLKDLLQNTIIANKVSSFDLNIGKTQGYPTLSGDSLFLSRTANATSNYILTVNNAESIISPSTVVRSQNLEFKNGVAHVTDNFTYYKPKTKTADIPNPANVTISSDTILVTKDAYINNGSTTNKNANFGLLTTLNVKFSSSDANLTRRAICQFPVRNPRFVERVGAIKLGLYINRVDGAGSLTIAEDQNVNWTENTINWNNAPTAGTTGLADIPIPATGGAFLWYNAEITSTYLSAIQAGKTFVNIGISTRSTPLFGIASRELAANRTPYIVLTSSPVTILKNPVNTGIMVDKAAGIKKIISTELKFEGTTAQNIFYTITSIPSQGFITVNSLPIGIGITFTQEQIDKGVVKYVGNGSGTADNFVLEVKDFQGGFFPALQTVNVQYK